jgi:hypothetical protein
MQIAGEMNSALAGPLTETYLNDDELDAELNCIMSDNHESSLNTQKGSSPYVSMVAPVSTFTTTVHAPVFSSMYTSDEKDTPPLALTQ